ncbi:unnamed protein product [Parnassius apollo]|uniref:(apollo) hypothetical protein n=1 Tax=Parnassius apollo TaxID=110799 RepID=A0A8S3XSX0_PARAO|nr:unnamed protein product [Parnassius apollo]
MNNSSDDSDQSGPSTPKKAKKIHYKQKFRDEWLKDNSFKTWLKRDPKDPYRAVCVMCDAKLIADRVVIKIHGEGAKHVKRTTAAPAQSSIATAFEKVKQSDDDKCKASEIKLAAFMAEHKISMRVMDHLVDLLPTMFPDSQIAKNMKMKRTKCQAIINNILGESEKQDLCADLKEQKFSLMIDESTDIGAVKTMCVVVRYYCALKRSNC